MQKRRHDRTQKTSNEPIPVAGRVPPHDLDAEAAVLSAIMLEPSMLDAVVDVLGDCIDLNGERERHPKFYSDPNGYIMGAILDLRSSNEAIDTATVAGRLRRWELLGVVGGLPYLLQLVDATPSIAHAADHAQIVFENWRLRQSIGLCQRVAAEGYSGSAAQELLDGLAASVHVLATCAAGAPMESLGKGLITKLESDFKKVESGEGLMGRRTGVDALDNKITGLHDGDLYIVAARPGMGKSAFALNIAVTIASPIDLNVHLFGAPIEYGVPFFSLEMPKEQLQTRLTCTEAGIDLRKYRSGQLEEAEWRRIFRAGASLSELPIWIDDTAEITMAQMRAKVRQLQSSWCRPAATLADGGYQCERKIGAVVIDYLQLAGGQRDGEKREEFISSTSRKMKKMAKDLKVPVIALSQLNRGVETRGKDKRPQLSDLRESGAIEQDADAIFFLYRDEYYNPGNASARGIAEIIIAKQRNGPTGKVLARFEDHCTRFSNLGASEAQGYTSEGGDE